MRLPGKLGSILNAQKKPTEYFFTLVIDLDHVAAAVWSMIDEKHADATHAVIRRTKTKSWEEKERAADQVLSALEEKIGPQEVTKVIFGLPKDYLNQKGNISDSVRTNLKELTGKLALKPIGFVPISQAVIHKLKKEEGIPPTVILIHLAHNKATVSLYKIGHLIGEKTIDVNENIIEEFEKTIRSFKDVEVLPSRIMFFGSNQTYLTKLKAEFNKHSWTTRANFLHFPKIEILPSDFVVISVSLAGASELADNIHFIDIDRESEKEKVPDQESHYRGPEEKSEQKYDQEKEVKKDQRKEEDSDDKDIKISSDNTDSDQMKDESNQFSPSDKDAIEFDKSDNISVVSAEDLGFKKDIDVLESKTELNEIKDASLRQQKHPAVTPKVKEELKDSKKISIKAKMMTLVALAKTNLVSLKKFVPKSNIALVAAITVILIIVLIYLVTQFLPKSKITISVLPKIYDDSLEVFIDPDISTADLEKRTIPGIRQEKTVSGEKVVSVTGVREVGDPAKGVVTIYNKSLTPQTLARGTVLVADNLEFVLDEETKIESATESIGSITFGKKDASITASDIGSKGNLNAGTSFTFEKYSDSELTARNDNALTEGVSREVTVVTRADYDNLITEITPDLIEKANKEISSSMSANLKLVEDTITTQVVDKVFNEEIGQETNQLHGVITLSISGFSYSLDEVQNFGYQALSESVAVGYVLEKDQIEASASAVIVDKEGLIKVRLWIQGEANPIIDIDDIVRKISSRRTQEATEIIKQIDGVADVKIESSFNFFGDKLPKRYQNITIDIQKLN